MYERQNPLEDMNLVKGACAGDQRAWALIVAKYGSLLRSIGRSYHLAGDEIDDALQETWLSAVAALPKLRDADKVGGWLGTIMRRSCLHVACDRRRRQERVVAGADPLDVPDDGVGTEEAVLTAERWSVVRDAVDRLPARDRELLRQLVSADNDGYDRIARSMRMPRGSIGPTRQRAIRRIRAVLAETQGADYLLAG